MRLTKITTRTGDDGTTGLADGSRLAKNSPRIAAIGTVDELNSQLGLLLTETLSPTMRESLLGIQHELFEFGGELAMPSHVFIHETHILRLENWLQQFNSELPPLKEFILPGGSRAAALCHVARTVCRRAERDCLSLGQVEAVSPILLQYLNRLSDLLFVFSRAINREQQVADAQWQRKGG
ncbi:MAG: cob(I)yrinic acid a,c-diamide adenosyltransferase [Polaromonas sp.]|uniref:cob(I)yrinic acid a,c-diamide adenosyltransferase n=1 Tax=Polaromonas sp. TaxID=1869339 RepID=UPI0027221C3F|nr:cob(I)yrinic acid a,c-diamide adenosyltransferase [Polaromonas sp.]MDO9189111.1 cob(I)yrinic acid a,c-diamide adenosyltransferase [Sulfurimicrobium sp.]MDO9114437.1 cob(I)yrinic acid a,c-diamide adenosyltransferase [Polaromonas sp.]MDP1705465.1 cob(I)yrinic acid a,c-diamide adenosyltransferase [Sulfurimicrobium sp.]MDP2199511.1 cob(I)yrinic acid a,c-diamide adenosyltransferase [Sulfurimicrobium sp.]MDP2961695.1 cob(I)yrinic acid a,c-diamide adenosyltransferase [Sulfurimicrobium sp.]